MITFVVEKEIGKDLCFDPALAELPTRVLPLSEVIDLLPNTHAPGRVEQYRCAMLRGERFPPISVIRLAGCFVVADGHKRFSAYKGLGLGSIVVEVWTFRRWLRDQWQQFRENARKNSIIFHRMFHDPRESGRLLLSTLGHWRRVATSLWRMVSKL